jgi:hypothetical protein
MKSTAIIGQVWATINIDDVNDVERYYEAESGLDDLIPIIQREYPEAQSVVLAFALAPATTAATEATSAHAPALARLNEMGLGRACPADRLIG